MFVTLFVLVAAAISGVLAEAPFSSYLPPVVPKRPLTAYGTPNSLSSGGYRKSYNAPQLVEDYYMPAYYNYGYEVRDSYLGSEFGHKEARMDRSTKGSYHVLLPDGRIQIVDYTADENGYRPVVRYEKSSFAPLAKSSAYTPVVAKSAGYAAPVAAKSAPFAGY